METQNKITQLPGSDAVVHGYLAKTFIGLNERYEGLGLGLVYVQTKTLFHRLFRCVTSDTAIGTKTEAVSALILFQFWYGTVSTPIHTKDAITPISLQVSVPKQCFSLSRLVLVTTQVSLRRKALSDIRVTRRHRGGQLAREGL